SAAARAAAAHAAPATTTTVTSAASSVAVSTASPSSSAAGSEGPQSVSVDSLPGAASANNLGPVPRGSGRLFVAASSGKCQLSVDGKAYGTTPVAGLDLAAGAHQLRCEAPSGKVKTSSVNVQDGATTRIRMNLDD
ncbi:MAG: Serine/threonine protein kinase, partial [Labilithrix sp.]|nr:Serine/threonine protein kinase [Labilithrix sp.]